MTDKEIIKALEDLIENFDGKAVDFMIISVALNLINRQKAEIKALQMDNKQLETDNFNANMNCEHLQAELERLERHTEMYHEVRAEAIKEFAERLKEKERPVFPLAMVIDVYEIDNLVKEMVGEG